MVISIHGRRGVLRMHGSYTRDLQSISDGSAYFDTGKAVPSRAKGRSSNYYLRMPGANFAENNILGLLSMLMEIVVAKVQGGCHPGFIADLGLKSASST
jgi:hypothetical protein